MKSGKNMNNSLNLEGRSYPIYGIYLLTFLLWLPSYQYQLSSDAVSYLSIARHFSEANWRVAINGFWSPLYSVLLGPAYWLKLDPALFARCLNGVTGLICLWKLHSLLKLLKLPKDEGYAILIGSIPLFCWYALMIISPDILVVGVCLYYVGFWLEENSPFYHLAFIILIGYFSKTYLLPILLIHTLIRGLSRKIRFSELNGRHLLLFLLILGVGLGGWGVLLFQKYETWTLGFSGIYNWRLVGELPLKQPYDIGQLIAPVHGEAISMWEDPSFLLPPLWSITEKPGHLLILLMDNVGDFFMGKGFGILCMMVLVGSLVYWVSKRRDSNLSFLLGFFWIFPVGYWLIVLEQRYVWINHLLCPILIYLLGDILLRKYHVLRKAIFFTAIFIMTFVPFSRLWIHEDQGVGEYQDGQMIQEFIPAGSSYATDQDWGTHLYLAYYGDLAYWGRVDAEEGAELEGYLVQEKIQYFAGHPDQVYEFIQYQLVPKSEELGFKLYEKME
ncbi:MAG: hypothetical protein AAF388_01785 [Bacteroidota bacterium]